MDEKLFHRENIHIGDSVSVSVQGNYSKTSDGIVTAILTNAPFHSRGILVELDSGIKGRVIRIGSLLKQKAEEVSEQNDVENIDPLSLERIPEQSRIDIPDDAVGYSYEKLFAPYLKNAHSVTIQDPYIILDYQVKNFVHFCSILINISKSAEVFLITSSKNEIDRKKQVERIDQLQESVRALGIKFSYQIKNGIHDRYISIDNTWRIVLGRGLDIFKEDSFYSVSVFDQTKRKCKQTSIDFIQINNEK